MNLPRAEFPVVDYDLGSTLSSGQAFRWRETPEGWVGIIAGRWVRLRAEAGRIVAETAEPSDDWRWLRDYLQLELDLTAIFAQFPVDDPALTAAVASCNGLRLLRQDPWECLASFICSSTKQIVQIQQIIALLAGNFGEPVAVPPGQPRMNAFPSYQKLAALTEAELRGCKLGFRAKYLLGTAQMLAAGEVDLARVAKLPMEQARAELMKFPGVGEKIADCVLLFAYGFGESFPVDVWIARALRQHYFPRRKIQSDKLRRFIRRHFGAQAGYAQQYLFHHIRVMQTD